MTLQVRGVRINQSEKRLLAEHLVNVKRGNYRNTTFNKLAQHYESVLAINQLNAQNLLL
jgi:hypothetical protein